MENGSAITNANLKSHDVDFKLNGDMGSKKVAFHKWTSEPAAKTAADRSLGDVTHVAGASKPVFVALEASGNPKCKGKHAALKCPKA